MRQFSQLMTLLAVGITASINATPLAANSLPFWVQNSTAFAQGESKNLSINATGQLAFSAGTQSDGVFTSAPIDAGKNVTLRLIAWIASSNDDSHSSVEIRGSETSFNTDVSAASDWVLVRNGQTTGLPSGRFFQYRITIKAGASDIAFKEVFIDTRPISVDSPRPQWDALVMSMMYQTSLEKLHALYGTLNFNASERGAYILRNKADVPIAADTYQYHPKPEETYLAARFGTWLIMRLHPGATFSPLTLRPSDVILRAKDGRQRIGPFSQHRAINFFDEEFMKEYLVGIRAAVREYRRNNPRVIGYDIAPPEFFYDSEPWPAMTYLGGFGDLAKARYAAFMAGLGIQVNAWPAMSDGDLSRDPNYYLWVYWRHWEASRYLARIARVIREEDPDAEIGALNYVADFQLRGVEPAFLEINPDFTFYYSSNMYPRVPGLDGLTGGTIFSYTRPNVLGHSAKHNLAEFDLWSPYIDIARSQTYARYAQMEHVNLAPIVFGDFLRGASPSNHLTKYHGMKGEPLTLDIIAKQGDLVRETQPLQSGKKQSQVAIILPGFSLYGLLQKDGWKPDRNTQLQLHLLGRLLRLGVGFDLISEGQVNKAILDNYKLVIYQNMVAYPWMTDALQTTNANLLVLGWAGTVLPPGPRHLEVGFTPGDFDLHYSDNWSNDNSGGTTSRFGLPSAGHVIEADTIFRFSDDGHALLRGLTGRQFAYAGRGRDGHALPYVADLQGQALARDEEGRSVFSVITENERRIIRFGGLLDHVDPKGADATLFSEDEATKFLENVLDFTGVEYFENLGALRVMRTSTHLLLENTGEIEFEGVIPKPVNPASDWFNQLPAETVRIPALGSSLWQLSKEEPRAE